MMLTVWGASPEEGLSTTYVSSVMISAAPMLR